MGDGAIDAGHPARGVGIHAIEGHTDEGGIAHRIRGAEHHRVIDRERIAYRRRYVQAGEPEVDPDRLAVVLGTGQGGGDAMVDAVKAMETTGNYRKVSPLAVQMIMPNGAAAVAGLELGARAGVITPVSACSSGSEAIAHAWSHVDRRTKGHAWPA